MALESDDFQYEEILKECTKKGVINKKLHEEKNALYSELLTAIGRYYLEKHKLDHEEELNKQLHVTISNHIKMSNFICNKHNFLDEKLTSLQKQHVEMEQKKIEIVATFCNQMEEVYNNLQRIPEDYDYGKMKASIKNCIEKTQIYEKIIPKLKDEIESMKDIMKNLEPCKIPNINEITRQIQKESARCLGEPLKIQDALTAIRHENKQLLQKEIT